MPLGICKLCGQEKELLKSHLIPAAAFTPLRARDASNPNPLIVTKEWIGQSSEQVAAHMCCRACEDIFNEGGEKWLLPLLATLDRFPLYEMVVKAEPLYREGEEVLYRAGSIAGFDLGKVIHFGMAIFWKASVRDWGTRGRQIYVDLGPYAESVRQFVLGSAPFPVHMCLVICVLPPTVPLLGTLMPIQTKQREFHRFKFYIPGVEFSLNVGKRVPPEMIEWSATGVQQIISSSPEFAKTFGKNYVDALAKARISPGFSRHLKERGRG